MPSPWRVTVIAALVGAVAAVVSTQVLVDADDLAERVGDDKDIVVVVCAVAPGWLDQSGASSR